MEAKENEIIGSSAGSSDQNEKVYVESAVQSRTGHDRTRVEFPNLDEEARRITEEHFAKCMLADGTIEQGRKGLINFVTNDLESKIKGSPKKSGTKKEPLLLGSEFDTLSNNTSNTSISITSTLITELESEAKRMSNELESLAANIQSRSHEINRLTGQASLVFEQSVSLTADQIETNIKSMYQIMAKCEELSIQMRPITVLQQEIGETKRLLIMLEKSLET